jgi:MarR family transcriptional regulator, organic hydroperoxide resistance regulator
MAESRTKAQLVQDSMDSLRRIVKAIEEYSRSVEHKFGLTGPQLWALWELGHAGPLSLKDLAARMHLEPSTVVGVVDRLVLKGLAVRNPDAQDRRRISLVPTAKGEEILAAAPPPAQGHLLKGLESMPRPRVQGLLDALQTLEQVLDARNIKAPFFFAKE